MLILSVIITYVRHFGVVLWCVFEIRLDLVLGVFVTVGMVKLP